MSSMSAKQIVKQDSKFEGALNKRGKASTSEHPIDRVSDSLVAAVEATLSGVTAKIDTTVQTPLVGMKIIDTNYILEPEQEAAIYKLYVANNKLGRLLFVDKITNENGVFKKKMYNESFCLLWDDNSIKRLAEIYGRYITFEQSIYCLLMVKDGATQNKYHEYMPYHDILFKLGAEKDLTQFINYYKMVSNPMYKPFYYETKNFFHARDENRFVYWLKCSLKNDTLFGPFYDDNMFDCQFNIDGKLMDICLLNKI